jgi:hypothetical protein
MFNRLQTQAVSSSEPKFGNLLGEYKVKQQEQKQEQRIFFSTPLLEHIATYQPKQGNSENIFA